MKCSNCQTDVNGDFELPIYVKLTENERDFIVNFFLANGSIKEMAKQQNISYPNKCPYSKNYYDLTHPKKSL